jgi:hypothetical protein
MIATTLTMVLGLCRTSLLGNDKQARRGDITIELRAQDPEGVRRRHPAKGQGQPRNEYVVLAQTIAGQLMGMTNWFVGDSKSTLQSTPFPVGCFGSL